MKTPYTNRWIALDALGPEDEDADLRDYVSVDLEDGDADDDAVADSRNRALAAPSELVRHHSAEDD